jgi:hypothetical protein
LYLQVDGKYNFERVEEMRLEINVVRQSQYTYMKNDMLGDLEREMANPELSDSYKKHRLHYCIREVADMNEVLGLPATDGVEKWLTK